MTRSPGLSTSAGARILRGCGVLLVGALWIGVTTTTNADGASARPGDSASPFVAAETMPTDAPARALPRLVAATAGLTGPSGQKLHAALAEAQELLGAQPPAEDAAADAAALEAAGPSTTQNSVSRAADAAQQTRALSSSLATAGLSAPPAQSVRLLTSAAMLDDAATATLKEEGKSGAKGGDVASVLPGTDRLKELTAEGADALGGALAPSFIGALCTGDAATTMSASTSATATAAAVEPFTSLDGLPTFSAQSTTMHDARADTLHAAGATAGRFAYASEVVAARLGTERQKELASQRSLLARALQAAQPEGCAPVVVTSAGEPEAFTGKGATDTMAQAREALADGLLEAGTSVGGEARDLLIRLWWEQRSGS